MSSAARRVEIVEVGPRDGLQDEKISLATADKLELVARLVNAGLRRLEVVSFAHPARVPQMADAEAVIKGLVPRDGVRFVGLVLNRRGLDRALACGVEEVNIPVVVTDTFSQKNQGMSTEAALEMWASVASEAIANGMRATVTLSAAFGCPYEGVVDPDLVVKVARRAAAAGPSEIILADTIGCAVPTQVTDLINAVVHEVEPAIRCHFHNTRNTGLANAVAAIDAGVSALDASVGGLGGCPFAPGAAGNIATEDLVYMLRAMGVETGVDLDQLLVAASLAQRQVGHDVPGMLLKAGPFPRR